MRRARLAITYNKTDISADIAPFVTSFEYRDESEGRQDSIRLSLADNDARWRNEWLPEKGATVTAALYLESWLYEGDSRALECGAFEIDQITLTKNPWRVDIGGTAVPLNSGLRNTLHTKAWQNVTLEKILREIATAAQMDAFYDVPGRKQVFQRLDQRRETNAQFLNRLANENGIVFKATDSQLIFYDQLSYEAKDAVNTIDVNSDLVTGFNITSKTDDVYTSCTVSYWDAGRQEYLSYTYDPAKQEQETPGRTGGVADDGGTYSA